MHPFSIKFLYAIVLATACYLFCYYMFKNIHGLSGIVFKSVVFATLYGGSIIYFKLSPDVMPVWQTIKNRAGIKKVRS